MKILVTGARGMIGSHLVRALLDRGFSVVGIDRNADTFTAEGYRHFELDLSSCDALKGIIECEHIDRIIHLAALAHKREGVSYSWEDYKRINVDCSESVFKAAGSLPVLYISTVDVYGFVLDGIVSSDTPVCPVSDYGKSKAMAEGLCKSLEQFDIFRFSPVYTDTVKRDIQKRYYLKYPSIAYLIGGGTEYEILNVENAVSSMIDWCCSLPCNTVRIIKDPQRMNTRDYINAEKAEGRARVVLRFPRWVVVIGYRILKLILGENSITYLLSKAVYPIRSSDW